MTSNIAFSRLRHTCNWIEKARTFSFLLFPAPTTLRVPFTLASSPPSESLEQATSNRAGINHFLTRIIFLSPKSDAADHCTCGDGLALIDRHCYLGLLSPSWPVSSIILLAFYLWIIKVTTLQFLHFIWLRAFVSCNIGILIFLLPTVDTIVLWLVKKLHFSLLLTVNLAKWLWPFCRSWGTAFKLTWYIFSIYFQCMSCIRYL